MRQTSLLTIYSTLVLSFIAYLLPWSNHGLFLRPDFVLLTLIFWLLRAPNLCGITTAWILGICVDSATGTLFGQYALTYTIIAFLSILYQRRLVLFNVWQESAFVFLLLVISQTILLLLKLSTGNNLFYWQYYWSSITGVALWLIIVTTFKISWFH